MLIRIFTNKGWNLCQRCRWRLNNWEGRNVENTGLMLQMWIWIQLLWKGKKKTTLEKVLFSSVLVINRLGVVQLSMLIPLILIWGYTLAFPKLTITIVLTKWVFRKHKWLFPCSNKRSPFFNQLTHNKIIYVFEQLADSTIRGLMESLKHCGYITWDTEG